VRVALFASSVRRGRACWPGRVRDSLFATRTLAFCLGAPPRARSHRTNMRFFVLVFIGEQVLAVRDMRRARARGQREQARKVPASSGGGSTIAPPCVLCKSGFDLNPRGSSAKSWPSPSFKVQREKVFVGRESRARFVAKIEQEKSIKTAHQVSVLHVCVWCQRMGFNNPLDKLMWCLTLLYICV
jgi:hypothetical protein